MAFDTDKAKKPEKAKAYGDPVGPSSLIRITMEVRKGIGDLSGKVDALGKDLAGLKEDTNKRLRSMEKALWTVGAVALTLVAVGGAISWILSPFLNVIATKMVS